MTLLMFTVAATWAADTDPFRPSGSLASGEGTLQGESPFLLGEGLTAGAHASFAQDLAVLEFADGRQESLVRHTFPIELQAGWTSGQQRARLEVFLPIYANVDAPQNDYRGAALGDLRLQGNIPVYDRLDAVRFGLVPRVEIPTGTSDALVRRGFLMGITLTAAGKIDRVGWVANTGISVSRASKLREVGLGSAVEMLGGAWWRPTDSFRIGAEADAQLGLVKEDRTNTVATWHGFAQTIVPSGWGLTVGAGSGLIAGVGAPDYRLFSALTYAHIQRDKDKDGIVDEQDACPLVPEDFDQFEDEDGCPEIDNDFDTIVDTRDSCPNDPEDFDGFEDVDGCPEADNDKDGLPDLEDYCPNTPGPIELNGCPDRDGDGVVDSRDRCPDDPGPAELEGCPDRDSDRVPDYRDKCPDDPIPADEDPATSDGCPRIAYITKDSIVITEKVKFQSGKADIKSVSFVLLDAVAALLLDNPELRKIEVAGHTDNVGSDRYNLGLSQRRANSVRAYLQGKDVAPNRLLAKGYGEARPTDTNRTEAGKQNNRRVEFVILEQEQPEPPPPPAPIPKVDELRTPWDAPPGSEPDLAIPEPAPVPAPVAPVPVVAPAPAVAPAPVAPRPSPSEREAIWDAPPTDLTNPWDEVGADPSNPDAGSAEAPAPARLTIYLRGLPSAKVFLDGDRIPQPAPFERMPIVVGSHVLKVVDAKTGLQHEETIDFVAGTETIRVLPPKPETIEINIDVEPKRGRRSKKRNR